MGGRELEEKNQDMEELRKELVEKRQELVLLLLSLEAKGTHLQVQEGAFKMQAVLKNSMQDELSYMQVRLQTMEATNFRLQQENLNFKTQLGKLKGAPGCVTRLQCRRRQM